MITDIDVSIRELHKVNNRWKLMGVSRCKCDYAPINNMVEASNFYTGNIDFKYRHFRKHGDCISQVCVTSPCNSLRKIYTFNYSGAKEV